MARYDPQKHHRRSIRLKGWDYRRPGLYFVTIDVQNHECLFGRVENQKMILNELGKIVNYQWQKLPTHFKHIELDEFIVMPNHLHGIIHIVRWPEGAHAEVHNNDSVTDDGDVGAKHFPNQSDNSQNSLLHNRNIINGKNSDENASPLPLVHRQPHGTMPGSLSAIIQNFESVSARKINRIRKTPGAKLWQRNYWEHIIRNDKGLNFIRRYIINNPLNWTDDDCYEM